VRFAGWVGPQDIGECYAKAKVSVVPSRWPEPFGMVGLEAMHYGGRLSVSMSAESRIGWSMVSPAPGAGTGRSSLRECFGTTARRSALCSKLGQQGHERVRTKFSFENYLDRLEAILSGSASRR